MTFLGFAKQGVAVCALMAAFATGAAATEFKVAVGDGAGGTQEALGKAFVAALEKQTGGAHTGKLFLNGQLGDEQDTVSSAAMNTLDFSILAINNITPFSPSVGTLTLHAVTKDTVNHKMTVSMIRLKLTSPVQGLPTGSLITVGNSTSALTS